MPVTGLPSQAVLIDQVAMLMERCAAFQTAQEESAQENARLRLDLLHRDHLLSDCVGPLELLHRLASLPPFGESPTRAHGCIVRAVACADLQCPK
jgi:hypothetical protein